VIELVQGEIVRDELQGGYGMTAEIALRDSGMTAEIGIPGLTRGSRGPGASSPTFSTPVVNPQGPSATEAPAPAAPAASRVPAGEPAQAAPVASTTPAPVSARPDAADPVTDQLGLAEKLGLRAPGERIDPQDQNVGPTS